MNDKELIVELIKGGFESLGKSIDVVREDVKNVLDKTQENSEKLVSHGEKIKEVERDVDDHTIGHKEEANRFFKRASLLCAGIGAFATVVTLFFNWISGIS